MYKSIYNCTYQYIPRAMDSDDPYAKCRRHINCNDVYEEGGKCCMSSTVLVYPKSK